MIHMIGNAHIDPVWLWQWPEGYQEVRATFASAVQRLDDHPDFVFTCDSALFFEWVGESDAELLERVREHVAAGRFEIVGGWWIEPDCNIPGGEAFVRHALYGQRFLHRHFGVTATVGANLDSFGHNATLPQILAKSGCDSYVFLRPGPHEKPLPAPLFRWRSPDGSSVLAYRIPHEYCAPRDDIGGHVDAALDSLPGGGAGEWAVFYGVGNHGGGPTEANLRQIAELDAAGPHRLAPSSLRGFFDSVADRDVPVVEDDLQHHARGCYTSESSIKRDNRRAENLLARAEKWSAVADWLGLRAYPRADLERAWKQLLFNQFHDTLAGSSIEPAYQDARDQLGHACSLAAGAFNAAVQSIVRQIEIPYEEGVRPVVVFNPHAWANRAVIELEYAWMTDDGVHLVDEAGAPVPVQSTRPLATTSERRRRIAFELDLPPLGYRTLRIHRGPAPETEPGPGTVAEALVLENERLRLEIDPASGRIASLRLAPDGTELADPAAPHAVVIEDHSDTWGHGVVAYDRRAGEFRCDSVRVLERGPVRSIVRVESRHGSSRLREDYVLDAGASHVDVRVTLDWHEQLALLKLRYPTTVPAQAATFEIPYGTCRRRADGEEQPGQSWIDVSAEGCGLALATDAKYGYDVRGGDIGISAVRSPVWAWHDPRELDPDGDFEYMDQGRQRFTVRLIPHRGDWCAARVPRRAAELCQLPFALVETFHDGRLPQRDSFADDGGGEVLVPVIKAAEDGEGYVVRAIELAGRGGPARIRALGSTIDARFTEHEIKTLLGDRETDLLEW
jgi:alpha-mannosidase